jgi:hypothetical protein
MKLPYIAMVQTLKFISRRYEKNCLYENQVVESSKPHILIYIKIFSQIFFILSTFKYHHELMMYTCNVGKFIKDVSNRLIEFLSFHFLIYQRFYLIVGFMAMSRQLFLDSIIRV